jgi:hypothetical protein
MKNIVKCAGLLAIAVGHFAEAANIRSKIKGLAADAILAQSKVDAERKANASAAAKALAEERKPKQVTIKSNIASTVFLSGIGPYSYSDQRKELTLDPYRDHILFTVDIPSECNPSCKIDGIVQSRNRGIYFDFELSQADKDKVIEIDWGPGKGDYIIVSKH